MITGTRRIVVGDVAGSILSQALANYRRELEDVVAGPNYPPGVRTEAELRLRVITGEGEFAPGLSAMVGPSTLPDLLTIVQ